MKNWNSSKVTIAGKDFMSKDHFIGQNLRRIGVARALDKHKKERQNSLVELAEQL